MSVEVNIHVTDLAVVMASYSKIVIERSATEGGFLPAGASEVTEVTFVSGTDDYIYTDLAGANTDWYRGRYANAGDTEFSGYSMIVEGEVQSRLVTLSEVRALVTTTLSDDDLSDVIAREEAELAAIIGPLSGERTEVFLLTVNLAAEQVTLRRTTNAVSVTDNGVAVGAADLRILADQRTILRYLTSTPPAYARGYWLGPVEVTYTPNDLQRVKRVLIDLVNLMVIGITPASGNAPAPGAIASETFGTYSYTLARTATASFTTEQRRRSLVATLLPKQSPTSIRIRSSVIGRRTLLGTVRP